MALTFDAEHPSRPGGRADSVSMILDTLSKAGAASTFFMQGRWASAYPEAARRIAIEGHVVGNHSNFHAPMTLLSEDGFQVDVRESERRIHEATGVDPRPWFRCPFGEGASRPEIVEQLGRLGYRNVEWTIDSGDWQRADSPELVEAAVLEGVRSSGGRSVVLFHTWPAATAMALPELIGRLRGEGVSLVTVAELAP